MSAWIVFRFWPTFMHCLFGGLQAANASHGKLCVSQSRELNVPPALLGRRLMKPRLPALPACPASFRYPMLQSAPSARLDISEMGPRQSVQLACQALLLMQDEQNAQPVRQVLSLDRIVESASHAKWAGVHLPLMQSVFLVCRAPSRRQDSPSASLVRRASLLGLKGSHCHRCTHLLVVMTSDRSRQVCQADLNSLVFLLLFMASVSLGVYLGLKSLPFRAVAISDVSTNQGGPVVLTTLHPQSTALELVSACSSPCKGANLGPFTP